MFEISIWDISPFLIRFSLKQKHTRNGESDYFTGGNSRIYYDIYIYIFFTFYFSFSIHPQDLLQRHHSSNNWVTSRVNAIIAHSSPPYSICHIWCAFWLADCDSWLSLSETASKECQQIWANYLSNGSKTLKSVTQTRNGDRFLWK